MRPNCVNTRKFCRGFQRGWSTLQRRRQGKQQGISRSHNVIVRRVIHRVTWTRSSTEAGGRADHPGSVDQYT